MSHGHTYEWVMALHPPTGGVRAVWWMICCSALQYVAACCSALQRVEVCCSVMSHVSRVDESCVSGWVMSHVWISQRVESGVISRVISLTHTNTHPLLLSRAHTRTLSRIHIHTHTPLIPLDEYCSTVQGLLDWFEVDLGFTELLFIQIDLCVLCVFVLYSPTHTPFVSC